jgi:predicted PurR-regulated permease PerM
MTETSNSSAHTSVTSPTSGVGSEGLYIPGSATNGTTPVDTDAPAQTGWKRSIPSTWAEVPWRTILATVGVVLGTYVLIVVILAASRIVTWVVIAGFLAIVLSPMVSRVEQRVGGRRSMATGIVVLATLVVLLGTVALFIMPVRTQLVQIITDLPGTVHDAANGRGPMGHLVTKLHVENYIKDNEATLTRAATRLSSSSFEVAKQAASAVFAFVTILLITFFFLSQSAAIGRFALNLMPMRRRASAQRIGADAAAAVSGYVIGNLIISLIAGVAAFIWLFALGIPNPIVLALFVAVADLIPLVGATLGAAVCVIAAFLQTPTIGIVTIIFFVIYQQVENGLIYPSIMARKVKVNPLVVILSMLLAVELFGMLGALLAVPVSGALQVVASAIRQERTRDQLVLPDSVTEPLDLGTGSDPKATA